jgi:hypothetical protein
MLSDNSSATFTFKESRSQWKASKLIVDVACTASYPTPNFNTDDALQVPPITPILKPMALAYGVK